MPHKYAARDYVRHIPSGRVGHLHDVTPDGEQVTFGQVAVDTKKLVDPNTGLMMKPKPAQLEWLPASECEPARLCTNCGAAPVWKRSPADYCRRCNDKAGHSYAGYAKVDLDKLEAVVGPQLADRVEREAKADT